MAGGGGGGELDQARTCTHPPPRAHPSPRPWPGWRTDWTLYNWTFSRSSATFIPLASSRPPLLAIINPDGKL